MKPESLIVQRCIKDFMLANNYSTHTVSITKKKVMDNIKSSSQRYKAYLEEQRQSKKKTEQQRKCST